MMNLTNIKEDEINFEDLKFLLKSNIRLNILVNLYFGKKNLSGLREELGKSSASLLHVLSELSSRKMVLKSERNYYLSSKGYLFALNLIKLFMNWDSFDRLESFWIKHDLNMIPIEFFQSSYLLVNSEIVKSEEVDFLLVKLHDAVHGHGGVEGLAGYDVEPAFLGPLHQQRTDGAVVDRRLAHVGIEVGKVFVLLKVVAPAFRQIRVAVEVVALREVRAHHHLPALVGGAIVDAAGALVAARRPLALNGAYLVGAYPLRYAT